MYSTYITAFGRNICESIGSELQACEFVSDCHDEFGYHESVMLEYMKNTEIQSVFTTEMTYNYISDFKVTKYFTEDKNGSLKFWNYDFNRFFPMSVRPSIIVIARSEAVLHHLENVIINEYSNSHLVKVPHPILPDQKISLKFAVSAREQVKYSHSQNEGTYHLVISFNIVAIPWYFKEWDITKVRDNCILQKEVLRQYFALYDLERGCANLKSSTPENAEADMYRLNAITSNKLNLLDILNIDKDMRDHTHVKQIARKVDLQGMSVQKACEQLHSEEIIADREKQIKELKRERERRQTAYQSDDSYYNDDYNYDDNMQGSSILGAAIDAFTETRRERKTEEKRLKDERDRRENERREYERREREERHRQSIQSQREWEAVRQANEERRRKGQPLLPLPRRTWY